jgi:hypothetical protein
MSYHYFIGLCRSANLFFKGASVAGEYNAVPTIEMTVKSGTWRKLNALLLDKLSQRRPI